jgi:hypothetical protein
VPNISKTSAFTSASSGFIFSGSLREATLLEGDGKGKNKSGGQTGGADEGCRENCGGGGINAGL